MIWGQFEGFFFHDTKIQPFGLLAQLDTCMK